jgi:chromosome segregation ATPase
MQQQTSGFETKNKLLNANISTLNQSLNAIKKKLKDRNEKEESQESQKQVKALKTEMANLQMLVQIKEKQLDDTAETIVGLKKGLKKEEHRRREAEDRVDRKIQLYKQEKNVKRDLQEEKEDLQAELEESSLQVVNLKLSFKMSHT